MLIVCDFCRQLTVYLLEIANGEQVLGHLSTKTDKKCATGWIHKHGSE
jgi:hypothetical protein